MIYVAVALMVGIMVGNGAGMSVGLKPWVVIFCVLFVLACVGYRCNKWLCDICLILSTVAFGAFLQCRQAHIQTRPLPEGSVSCEAIVVGIPRLHGKVIQTDAQIVTVGEQQLRHPMKARLSFLRDTLSGETVAAPALGDGIAFYSRLQRPGEGYRATVNSHFDSRRWLLSQGYCVQTLISPYDWHRVVLPLRRLGRVDRVRLRVGKWREQLLGQYRRMGIQGEQYAVLAAMTLGDKSCLTKTLRRVYSQTGTSHVLALSGLHLSIVFNILLLTFGLFRINRWVSYWLTLLALWSCCHHVVDGQHRFVASSQGSIAERAVLSGGDRACGESWQSLGCLFPVVFYGGFVFSRHRADGREPVVSPLSSCRVAMVHNAYIGDSPVGYSSFGGLLLWQSVGLFSSCQSACIVVVDASVASVVFLLSVPPFAMGSSCECLPTALLAVVVGNTLAQSWSTLDVVSTRC